MQINMNNINSNVEEDLKYFKDRAKEQEQMKILERKRQERDDRSKLSLKNANEFLFIPEEIEIEVSYTVEKDGEENKEISITLPLQEMNLYDLFKYLTDKKYESIDFLIEKHCGGRYLKIKDNLPEEQKLQILEQIEELSNIKEMFSSGSDSEEDPETEEEKKIKEKMEKVNTMADCIKAFGGTITYLCETWGKMPVEVLKGLTYRQFKWYLDIIVAKQKELDKIYNNKKDEGESWDKQKGIGNDGAKYGDYERTPSIAEQIAQGKYGNKNSGSGDGGRTKSVYDNGSITPGRIAKEGEVRASESGGNVLLDINRSGIEREGYRIVEDYEGAVVFNKRFKVPDWKIGEIFDM